VIYLETGQWPYTMLMIADSVVLVLVTSLIAQRLTGESTSNIFRVSSGSTLPYRLNIQNEHDVL